MKYLVLVTQTLVNAGSIIVDADDEGGAIERAYAMASTGTSIDMEEISESFSSEIVRTLVPAAAPQPPPGRSTVAMKAITPLKPCTCKPGDPDPNCPRHEEPL
jgi:hypothetical protein